MKAKITELTKLLRGVIIPVRFREKEAEAIERYATLHQTDKSKVIREATLNHIKYQEDAL